MKIHYGLNDVGLIKNPVVTTGSFDGVHVGHKTILSRLNELASTINGESVLITFHPHPRKILFPDTAGKDLLLINSQKEKIELLSETGLDHLVIINFTIEFSRITSIEFIRNILVGKLHCKKVVIGFNHHFGHNREGNYNYLYELGQYYNFDVEEIPEQDIQKETVSSTLIRKAISEGKIQRANAYLDHHYMIIGCLLMGSNSCESVNFPAYRIDIEEDSKLIPPEGVYAVAIYVNDKYFKAILNIKYLSPNSKVNSSNVKIDIHVHDCPYELKNQDAKILFAKRIRDEKYFSSPEQMLNQLKSDLIEVEDLIY